MGSKRKEKEKEKNPTTSYKQQLQQVKRSALATEKTNRKRDPRERYLDELLS